MSMKSRTNLEVRPYMALVMVGHVALNGMIS